MTRRISFLPRFARASLDAVPVRVPGNELWVSNGRQAIAIAAAHLFSDSARTVLIPASVCRAVAEAYIGRGFRLRRYNLDDALQPDLRDAMAQLGNDVAAVHVVHQFGFRGGNVGFARALHSQGIAVIVDRALAAYQTGELENNTFEIFSPWKTHPIPDGGILRYGSGIIPSATLASPAWGRVLRRSLGLVAIRRGSRRIGDQYDPLPCDSCGLEAVSQRMSPWSSFLLRRMDHQSVACRRRTHFQRLLDACTALGPNRCRPVISRIEPEDIPYCMPILVDDALAACRHLQMAGIESEVPVNPPFSGHPMLDNRIFPSLERLARQVIALPVHQNLTEKDLSYIIAVLERTL